jgi:hypothetical protein
MPDAHKIRQSVLAVIFGYQFLQRASCASALTLKQRKLQASPWQLPNLILLFFRVAIHRWPFLK